MPVQRERSSLTLDMEGTRSQTALVETSIGTDNNAPGTPQSHIQKISEIKMQTGFSVNRRPSRTGVMMFASERWNMKYHPTGRTAFQNVSKARKPTMASRMMPTTGPKYGTKFNSATSIPHMAG